MCEVDLSQEQDAVQESQDKPKDMKDKTKGNPKPENFQGLIPNPGQGMPGNMGWGQGKHRIPKNLICGKFILFSVKGT